jgi:hypothetical protein
MTRPPTPDSQRRRLAKRYRPLRYILRFGPPSRRRRERPDGPPARPILPSPAAPPRDRNLAPAAAPRQTEPPPAPRQNRAARATPVAFVRCQPLVREPEEV